MYANRQPAPYGLYLSTKPLDVRFVGAEGEDLEGTAETYMRVPTVLSFVLAPVLGAVFVVAFPVVIFVAVSFAVLVKFNELAEPHWVPARFQPTVSFLSNPKGAGTGTDPELADLVEEVEARRKVE